MKKILLSTLPPEGQYINWTTPGNQQVDRINKYIPLGILSLATNLPDKYDIKIIDPGSDDWSIEKTINVIQEEKPDILGISAITRRTYSLKKILEDIDIPYIAVGGPHTTNHSEQTLGFGADAVFIGGLADLEFQYAIENNKKGIIRCNTNINEIKFPNRELIDYKEYFPTELKQFKTDRRMVMFSSIGCPHKCIFCNIQLKKLQFKNPEIILDEMEYLKSLGSRSIHILDDNFNISSKHVKGILDEMDKRDFYIEWSGRGQTRMDFSLLPRLKEHGFKRMHVGIEALDDNILKFFNKNETVKDVYKFCNEMNENDIDIVGYFIVGTSIETRKYRRELPEKIKELGIKYQLINMLFPEPNTEYYKSLVHSKTIKKDYWDEYMKNPVPDFEIPYPYGDENKRLVLEDVQYILDELKC